MVINPKLAGGAGWSFVNTFKVTKSLTLNNWSLSTRYSVVLLLVLFGLGQMLKTFPISENPALAGLTCIWSGEGQILTNGALIDTLVPAAKSKADRYLLHPLSACVRLWIIALISMAKNPLTSIVGADRDAYFWIKKKLGLSEYQMGALVWFSALIVGILLGIWIGWFNIFSPALNHEWLSSFSAQLNKPISKALQ